MTNYYFKIATPNGIRYCCFVAEDQDKARRNALFTCFASHHSDENNIILNQEYPIVEDRYDLLAGLYLDRIEDTTKEIYEQKDERQYD